MLMDDPGLATELHHAVAAVAPIFGVSVGDWLDRSTWEVQFRPSATDEEKAAAQAVIDGFQLVGEEPPPS